MNFNRYGKFLHFTEKGVNDKVILPLSLDSAKASHEKCHFVDLDNNRYQNGEEYVCERWGARERRSWQRETIC